MTSDPARVLRRLLSGRGAHVDVLAAVDVPFDVASREAIPEGHTIWQLVWHLNYWMEYELDRLDGRPRPYPEHAALSWPSASADADAWRREHARFTSLLGRLTEWTHRPHHVLDAPVLNPPQHEERRKPSAMEVLWDLVAHNSYHIGQVVAVRQALGAWPPERGRDTW